MRLTLLLGFIVGFAGVVAGAYHLPWGAHDRVPARTSVQANGGRLEQFVIRLPADRVGGGGHGPDIVAASARWPVPLPPQPLSVEHFKVRDVDDQIIGVATRHQTATEQGEASAWWVVIPGRGALLLAGRDRPAALDEALQGAGWQRGRAWSGQIEAARTEPQDGVVLIGSREFAGLEGHYSERWSITGIAEDGELRGTVELATVTRSGS